MPVTTPTADSQAKPVWGLIVNPVAGLGGSAGLHGSDGELASQAVALGAKPIAGLRARRALVRLAASLPDSRVVAAGGLMGEDVAREFWDVEVLPVDSPSSARDTRTVARSMQRRGVKLIVFAGGDGTASDIASVVGTDVPLVGIPTGVKMHSGVFGRTPESAGELAAQFLSGETEARTTDVLDVPLPRPEAAPSPEKLGVATVPYSRELLQRAKASGPGSGEADLRALAREIAIELAEDACLIVGPGTGAGMVMQELGLEPTLAGVDVVREGRVVLRDASESDLLSMLEDCRQASIILGVIGGQGFLLGRGNQQISTRVIRRVGEENITIVAPENKLLELDPPVLLVDTGVDAADPVLTGHRRVLTGPGRSVIMRVVS